MSRIVFLQVIIFCLLTPVRQAFCQSGYRPALFFREDFKEIPAETPVTQEHICNEHLSLCLYGTGSDSIKKSHHDQPSDDPYYIWSGLCTGNWAVTFTHRESYADLSGYAKVIWRTRQSGFRNLRLLIKLKDGTWLVSDQYDDRSEDWRIREYNISDINWYIVDIKTVTEKFPANDPDLTRVDEIGFTDLMPGGLSDACSRIDWIEVYANPIPREKN
jgi:hypothetical protein